MFDFKMVKYCYLIVGCCLLTACQPKLQPTSEPDEIETPASTAVIKPVQLEGGTDKLQFTLPECDNNSCPEVSIEHLQSNQQFVDQYIDQAIIKHVNDILSLLPNYTRINEELTPASTAQSQEDQLEVQLQPAMALFLQLDQELKDLNVAHKISLTVKPRIINAGQPLATVMLNSNHYLGGAHGSSTQKYYNFDLKQQKLMQLEDILQPKQKANLEKIAHHAFENWVIETELATDPKEYEQAWKFSLADNFYLSPQGLVLQYGEYEIGPYVVGLPRLIIDYAQLKTVLKPEYLPKPEPLPTSEPKS